MTQPVVKKIVFATPQAKFRHKARCQAKVTEFTQRYRYYAGKDMLCERHALYSVDGEYFCKLHAGDRLVELLCKAEEIVGS